MWVSVILAITCIGLGTTGAQVISPTLKVEPTDVLFDPGSSTTSVSFQCSATGDPAPEYVWYKEYVDLDTITRQPLYQTSGGTLTIPAPKASDQGRYWCQAFNEYGRVVSVGANLTFAYVNDFDPAQRTGATTTSGNGTLLPCSPPGAYPGLVYHWIEAGKTAFIPNDVRKYASQNNGDYYFANVSPDDNGLYQCGVKINLNTDDATAPVTGGFSEFSPETPLTVTAASPVPTSPPQLVLFETIQYKRRGDNVLMEFFAYGNPTPTLDWRRVDAVGGNAMEFPASVKYEQWKRAMTLTNVAVADQGFYEVTATNTLGTDVKTAQLVIEDVPQYIKKLETQNLDQAPGEDVNLEVTWKDDGRNTVTPSWYYNGVDIVPDDKYIVTNSPAASSLTVKNAQPADAGSYQSILQNQYGMVPSFSEVRVGAPSKVTDLKLVEKGDNSATIAWSEPPTKANLDGYQIQYNPTDSPDSKQYMDVGKTPTQATIPNSNPDISTYRVRAKTVDGIYGPYSDPLVNGVVTPIGDGRTATDTPRTAGGGGVPLLAWLLPLLLLLLPLLLLLLFCCCCKGWCAGKKKEKAIGKGTALANLTPMSRVHQEMLRTYRTTIVDNMKAPGKVTTRMANEKVINANMVQAIASHPVRQDKSKKLLDSMVLGGDKSFDSFCGGLRKDEKLDWLADTLEGQGLSMDNRKRLEAHKQLLVNKMDPESTLTSLTQNQIYSNDMAEYCMSANSTEEQNKRILHLMQSRSDEDFSIFCSGLRANGQQAHIADLLQVQSNLDSATTQGTGEKQLPRTGEGIDMTKKEVIMEDEFVKKEGMSLNQSGVGFGLGAAGVGLGTATAAAGGLAAAKGGLGTGGAQLTTNGGLGTGGAQLTTQSTSASGMRSAGTFGTDLGLGSAAGQGLDMDGSFKGRHGAVVGGGGHRYLIDATAPQGSLMSASSTVVPPGQPVILEVRGEVDQVEWLYNGGSIRGDPGISTHSDGFLHELHIDRMSPERDGTYTCRGETPDGGAVACDIKVQTLI
ncbi:CNTN5 [Branchiostoma lanceolatum]|uniref:CNTN5 protein n=1 Tax=Branchiostoma lanceolatum TaxID=7740 RepID=A0A8K0EJR5_BRALA|nr:CNTN5 [Branchiostoma lanceolatum]